MSKIDDGFDEGWLTLLDHNGAERQSVHPYLMFDAKDGIAHRVQEGG